MSTTNFIKLNNHLDNGGSFTLNANKTISINLKTTYSQSSVQVKASYQSWNENDQYKSSLSINNTSSLTIGEFTLTKGTVKNSSDNYDEVYFVTPKPSSIVIDGNSSGRHLNYNASGGYIEPIGAGSINETSTITIYTVESTYLTPTSIQSTAPYRVYVWASSEHDTFAAGSKNILCPFQGRDVYFTIDFITNVNGAFEIMARADTAENRIKQSGTYLVGNGTITVDGARTYSFVKQQGTATTQPISRGSSNGGITSASGMEDTVSTHNVVIEFTDYEFVNWTYRDI